MRTWLRRPSCSTGQRFWPRVERWTIRHASPICSRPAWPGRCDGSGGHEVVRATDADEALRGAGRDRGDHRGGEFARRVDAAVGSLAGHHTEMDAVAAEL